MQSGGIRAVAIATPGITFVFSFLVVATIPAKPPKNPINTSHTVGVVLASSSDWAELSGEIKKYKVDVVKAIMVAIARFLNPFLRSEKSFIPAPYPIPMIGPISGEISMAPIMTAVEFTFRPMEAMKIANISTQRFAPLISTSPLIRSSMTESSALFSKRLSRSFKSFVILGASFCALLFCSIPSTLKII